MQDRHYFTDTAPLTRKISKMRHIDLKTESVRSEVNIRGKSASSGLAHNCQGLSFATRDPCVETINRYDHLKYKTNKGEPVFDPFCK